MIIDYILTAIIIICIIVIIFIIGRKIPKLKVLDIQTITEEKESQTKRRIIEERLQRKSASLKQKIIVIFKPLVKITTNIFKDISKKINNLEKEYQQATIPKHSKISELLEEAGRYIIEEKYDAAEESYIEVIELDSKNILAYQGLGELYLLKKDYKKAKQSLQHALKLLKSKSVRRKPKDSEHLATECLAKMGSIDQQEGNLESAINYFRKAVEAEPNNPKYLDLLLKISIILKDKDTAKSTLAALKKADPDNQKLEELEKQVKEIS
jgi:tetratricopeptide (TPR) repeat protein